MDCCNKEEQNKTKYDFDLVFIGSGSAAFAGAIKGVELDKKIAIIEKETLGGTCVNVGCVPSKNLIRAAETKHRIENSSFEGIKPGKSELDFEKLINNKDNLVNLLRQTKYQSILDKNKPITYISGEAKFIDPHTLDISGKKLTSDKVIISTGSSPFIPPIPGLKESGCLTSTSAFELKKLPPSIAILGGGYIALETAQMFKRLGVQVTIIQRSEILFQEDKEIGEWVSSYLKKEGISILNKTEIKEVSRRDDKIILHIEGHHGRNTLQVDRVLAATGRKANTIGLNLEKIGVALNTNGTIKVNEYCQTSLENIYAAGDVTPSPALVYVAAYEGNLAAENALLENKRKADYTVIPWVIFTDPQIVGVGLNEAQAKANGIEYDVSFLTMDNVPRAIAAQDTRGFIKLLKKTGTQELIGARILAPEGSELIMEISIAIKYKIPVSELSTMMHPYLTLSEAVKLAALAFNKDIRSLSCCAS